jgi:hypothetical protein
MIVLQPAKSPTSSPTMPDNGPTYCGCDSCTQEIWDAIATDSGGSYSCGSRIEWVQSTFGRSEHDACVRVSVEFAGGPCGPLCDPTQCNSIESKVPTKSPSTPGPSSSPTSSPTASSVGGPTYCGCVPCTQEIWDAIATDSGGSYSCGSRITWLQSSSALSEYDACARVSAEFSDGPCGPLCNPTKCNSGASFTFFDRPLYFFVHKCFSPFSLIVSFIVVCLFIC